MFRQRPLAALAIDGPASNCWRNLSQGPRLNEFAGAVSSTGWDYDNRD